MAAPANSNEFLDLVRKSGVTDEKRLDAHVQKLRATGTLPNEPGKLAGMLVRDGLLTHFQAEQILQGKWRRFTLGKYKVLERLGSGGMGQVFLAEHKLMRRRVAIKVLPTAKAADESSLLRFQREARAAAALDHPNIVHAYDIDQDDALHFLVMEYVDGASLQEIVKKSGPLDPVRAAHYIAQAAQGLDHAHLAGLVHRDIKPANILVDRNGTVKILDMGLARFFNDEDDMLTKNFDENVLGTADYLAPEQAIDSHSVDIRADIYGLGATFYFLLAGRTPFGEGTTAQKLIWHQTRRPRPLSELRNDVPADMAAVIDRMLAKDAAQRYQTPAEVVAALAPWSQKPIAPPAEREMPQLSLAASGSSPSMEPTQVGAQTASVPSSGPRKNWQVTGGPVVKPPSSPGTKTVTPAAPAATTPMPPIRPQSVPVAPIMQVQPAAPSDEEEEVPWEQVTSDTEDLTTRADTGPRSPVPGRRAQATGATVREARRFWKLAAVISVVGLALLVGAGFLFGWFGQLFGSRPTGPVQQTLRVSRQAAQANAYQSIRQALEHARPGDRIILLDQEYREPAPALRLEGARCKDIHIEAAAGVEVVWKPFGKSGQALLTLHNASGVHIKGVTFDGENHVDKLVRLSGKCPGLRLEDVKLIGFTKFGLSVANCAGEANHPVLLQRINARGSGKNVEAALIFSANPRMNPAKNAYIRVEDCRFEGNYKKSAVEVSQGQGPGVDFTNNVPEVKLPGAK